MHLEREFYFLDLLLKDMHNSHVHVQAHVQSLYVQRRTGKDHLPLFQPLKPFTFGLQDEQGQASEFPCWDFNISALMFMFRCVCVQVQHWGRPERNLPWLPWKRVIATSHLLLKHEWWDRCNDSWEQILLAKRDTLKNLWSNLWVRKQPSLVATSAQYFGGCGGRKSCLVWE